MLKHLFCEKCGKPMNLETTDGKKIMTCACGYSKELTAEMSTSEKIKKPVEKGGGVLGKKKSGNFPHRCPKCHHVGCEVIDLGSPVSDEAAIHLYICDKCGYTDRQSEGSGNM